MVSATGSDPLAKTGLGVPWAPRRVLDPFFYLLDFDPVQGKTAVEAAAFLETQGIIPRPGSADRFLRITIGTDVENEAVLDTLGRYLAS